MEKNLTKQTKERKVSAFKIKLVSALSVASEDRSEPLKGNYPGGRFKRYIDILKTYFQPLMIVNLLTLIFCLPIIGILVFFEVYGVEQFGYLVAKISQIDPPFLLGNFGIGASSSLATEIAKSYLLNSYRVMIGGIALFLPLAGVGIAGNMYICTKMVWGESLLMKKDKYGNDVPRVIKEFFKGVKEFSGRIALTLLVFGIIFAGCSLMIVEFVNSIWLGISNAGYYIGLILAAIIIVFSGMVMVTYLPFNISYKSQKTAYRIKNSLIISSGFSVSAILSFVFALFPFALLLTGDMVKLVVTIAILSFGLSHACLVMVNYADYNSENLIQPLYQQEMKAQLRKERKQSKKPETMTKQTYKKKPTK